MGGVGSRTWSIWAREALVGWMRGLRGADTGTQGHGWADEEGGHRVSVKGRPKVPSAAEATGDSPVVGMRGERWVQGTLSLNV